MSPMQIERYDERHRILADVLARRCFDLRRLRCAPAIASVKNLAVIRPDRLAHTVRTDVLDELVEGLALEQRKEFGQRMKLHDGSPLECSGGNSKPRTATPPSIPFR